MNAVFRCILERAKEILVSQDYASVRRKRKQGESLLDLQSLIDRLFIDLV